MRGKPSIPKVTADGSDLEKVKAAHDWICTHVTYYNGSYNEVASNVGEPEPVTYGLMEDYYGIRIMWKRALPRLS